MATSPQTIDLEFRLLKSGLWQARIDAAENES